MLITRKIHIITITIIIYAISNYINDNLYTKLSLHFDYNVIDDRFQLVSNIFRKNFLNGWERGGAALTVYHKNQKILDIWGGYADVQAARKWQMDTITSTFSCLKNVMALCIALLVERKLANYDDLIIKYWPNFGDNNKANITIKMLLTDKMNLKYLNKPLTLKNATDHEAMRKIFENEQPKWLPEEKSGCYGSLFYWLIDQLIRHIDKQKRGIDYSIGLMKTEEYRLARIAMPSWFDIFSEIYQTPHLMSNLLFQFFTHKLSTDKLLSPANQFLLEQISINSTDICTIKHLAKNIGLLVFIDQSQVSHAYGHSAFGCQQVIHDRRNNLTIAYVTNAIKVGVYNQCRTYIRLHNAIYDIIEKN
ncbi:Uncharacterized protein BM_BM13373 [Brugia malayi]|uniref:Beta-lactamase domain-containing protein n=1 Tax=Brugia malayi TaxID=6279 RepID=A0A4E9FS79_BRUMA|nr:Uncharacterized protein BM_BM13373 [Brugia malayi]VIO95463.1 Uncharacterized protein BM_BM13373 [Brugia malayi]